MRGTLGHLSAEGKAAPGLTGALLLWYERHARALPWRVGPAERRLGFRPDPYRVWLSEVMLQQTTVKAVIPYFHAFLGRWPDVRSLSAAPDEEVLAAWAGLGYYSRARNLHAAAREIAARGGRFPDTAAALEALPGVGVYTAAAVAALAFDEPAAVVDGNVERVVSRVLVLEAPAARLKAEVRFALHPLVPADRPGEFAEALMDLGATICTPRRPACSLCPWAEPCRARAAGRQEDFPARALRKERPRRFGHAFVAVRADGAIVLRRRVPKGLLGGMAEVPCGPWTDRPGAPHPPLAAAWSNCARPVVHTFTHFELTLTVWRADLPAEAPAPEGHWWSPSGRLAEEALPSVMRKAIAAAIPELGEEARKPR